ncbi:TPA: tyrosine-type recombinase/integrase [Yersinia enterocolitica]|uniref:Integrase n=3 Tax=Yersinia TaxID=629 RepID=A0A209A2T3_YERIN|nr:MULTISPECIES: integrase arm-type DNA-binding domain-containing protein [Yersinia]EKN3386081.1 integrase arm-type DNA-binding domain-containing protein [Yersinia enterocolitica]EKN3562514.1 integrase arm-type DNA-binding domain-containing protein [Yersinia enterocolitica]EKN3637820.1 integrase arm-type DNA-binding domain-containing protein [Yersinia enterocolitica]EKN3769019.1 integrase arm-type DNA-binding domain-containing protein [Yersinia enterocolitica]EKN4083743.1 integrase arm-type DN
MKLTDTKARNAKPQEKAYQLQDGNGLYLDVRPSGVKTWRYRYWITPTKDGRYTIGSYPAVSLAEARRLREWAREQVKNGIAPKEAKAVERDIAKAENANTFEIVAKEWLDKKGEHWAKNSKNQITGFMYNDIFPAIGAMPMREINASHILKIIRDLESRGAKSVAVKVRQWCSAVFCYGVATLRADSDPAAALRGAIIVPKTEHSRPLTGDELRDYYLRLDSSTGNQATIIALRILPLVFVRQAELRSAEWSHIDFDNAEWVIPPELMKMGRMHRVPLSAPVISLLNELKKITGNRRWLFPNTRLNNTYMGASTLNRAIVQLGYARTVITTHDFRATASTRLHEMGYRHEVIERQLAHVEKNRVSAAYNHAEYMPERRQLMEEWGHWVTGLLASDSPQ